MFTNLPALLRRQFNDSPFADFDNFFDEALKTFPGYAEFAKMVPVSKSSYPKVNVVNEADKVIVEAAVPGLTKDNISIDVDEDNILCIAGEKVNTAEQNERNYVCREISKSSFKRSWKLGDNLDRDNIDASVKNGILYITIGKKKLEEEPKVKKRTIKIK